MTDHHPDYLGVGGLDDGDQNQDLIENDNQGLETASTLGITNNAGLTHSIGLDEDDAGDYFNGAIELAKSNKEPFDDPLLGSDDTGLESSHTLDVEYDHNDGNESEGMHDVTAATTSVGNLDLITTTRGGGGGGGGGGGDGMNNGLGLLQGGVSTTKSGGNTVQLAHRHELHERAASEQGHSVVGGLIWALVVVHVLLLIVLIVTWLRQKRSKDPTMRSLTPGPPQKVGCSYDLDKSYSLPKIELGNLPIKALKTLKQAKA